MQTSSGTDWRHYVPVGGRSVAVVSRRSGGGGAVHYMLEDHQGSPSVLSNSGGAAVVRESFGAFGLPRDGASWSGAVSGGDQSLIEGISRRGYTSHTMLGRMGLVHMNGRVMDAVLGRFLSADPHVTEPGSTQGLNRYSYVLNNPLSHVDPSGFACENFSQMLYNYTQWIDLGPDGKPDTADDRLHGQQLNSISQIGVQLNCHPDNFVVPLPPNGSGSVPQEERPQGHDYWERNRICRRELTSSEWGDLLDRFGVPNNYTRGDPQGGNGRHLVTALYLPGGVVRSTYAADGLSVRNVTTAAHAFVGTIDRWGANLKTGAYFVTHGFGDATPRGYGPMFGVIPALAWFRDPANQYFGPKIFDRLDQAAARYASANFDGC